MVYGRAEVPGATSNTLAIEQVPCTSHLVNTTDSFGLCPFLKMKVIF